MCDRAKDWYLKNFGLVSAVRFLVAPLRRVVSKEITLFLCMIEQRTGNKKFWPCVPGSIPGGTTLRMKQLRAILTAFIVLYSAEIWRKMVVCFLKCFLENDNS